MASTQTVRHQSPILQAPLELKMSNLCVGSWWRFETLCI